MDQNIDSFGSDQIQTQQDSVIHPPSQEITRDLIASLGKKFAIQHAQPEDSNELFQKLLEDLRIINKELAEYINSPSWDCPTFFNDNEDHSIQYKEYLENPSNEIATSNSNQEKEKPPQHSDIRQLIKEECCIEVCRKQKQNMEDTILELIEKKQEVKNVVEQPTERGTHIAKSFQNFRVIHKSSNSFNKTSQISLVYVIAPVLPTEEPEYSLSMGYEHLSTIPETELDEVLESSAKNLLPIPSEYEVTSDDESKCDVPIKDDSSPVFTTFSNPLFNDNDDFNSSDDESLSDKDVPIEEFKVYLNPLFDDEEINSDEINPHCFNAESDFVESLSNHDTLIDSSPNLMGRLFTINPCPRLMENSNAIVETLPTSPILIEGSDSQREEIDIFTGTDELLPPSTESDDYDSEGEINVLEELLVGDSISLSENKSFYFDHQDDPSFPRPPLEPPDDEFDFEPNSGEVISAVMNNIDEFNED
uniref:Reverse transcriptase domain-containing protein n=1 Tax=Tanacetum cinerariifolium TaxID=118510 RepID=A0A6L2M939_TANCI|nr:hypothetical protein [Tanacetum cinerariifolium]